VAEAGAATGGARAAGADGRAAADAGTSLDAALSPSAPALASSGGAGAQQAKDKYLTDPVPSGRPLPVEPEDAQSADVAYTATLSVRCDTILGNMDLLDREKHELVPPDGVIFPPTAVTFYEGESVFNVLRREMKRAGIHMEFVNTPIYNSAYIEGINNLYEFDVGELSGWMYSVTRKSTGDAATRKGTGGDGLGAGEAPGDPAASDRWFPNYGCSRYLLQDGDIVEWSYTCDLGRDLGVAWLAGGEAR
jgi:hypothetical protein